VSVAQASTIAANVSVRVGGDADPLVGGVEADGGFQVAGAQMIQGAAFGTIALAEVLVEDSDDVGVTVQHCLQRATGADRGELAVVTDDDQLGAGSLGAEQEPGQVEVRGHAGLVDHDHCLTIERDLAVVEPPEQRPHGGGR
jgi:hypothetical protein